MTITPEKRREMMAELVMHVGDACVAIAARCPSDRDVLNAVERVKALLVLLREDRDPGRQVMDPPGFATPPLGRVVARTPPVLDAKDPKWQGTAPDLWAMAQEAAKKSVATSPHWSDDRNTEDE